MGRIFIEELIKKGGYAIYAVNRGSIPIRKEQVQEITCDRHDLARMREVLPPLHWCAVIDFCAYTPDDIAGTLSVLTAEQLDQYIYISTASVYAPTWDFPIREDAPKLTAPQAELGEYAEYGYNKWLAEVELRDRSARQNIAHTCLRPAFIYGKYNYAPRESYFFDLIVKEEKIIIPADGLALFSFVSVWDVAHIIIGCLENKAAFNREFNAASGELISYRRLVQVLKAVTAKRLDVETLDIDEINRRQIPLPFPLDEHLIYDGSGVQSIMDFSYTPFLSGMKETFRYYKIGRGLP